MTTPRDQAARDELHEWARAQVASWPSPSPDLARRLAVLLGLRKPAKTRRRKTKRAADVTTGPAHEQGPPFGTPTTESAAKRDERST